MYCINHWIPAFACLLQAGRNDGEATDAEKPESSRAMTECHRKPWFSQSFLKYPESAKQTIAQ